MIKRLLSFIAAVALVAVSAAAQPVNRDMLLTADGTLYTVESVAPSDAGVNAPDSCILTLVITKQQNGDTTRISVPYTLTSGAHFRPAMAYDSDSKTLFLFWTHAPNAMSSELLFATMSADGKWSDLTTFEDRSYRLRFNLAIAITRKVWTQQGDNSYAAMPGLSAHAVWWEQTGAGEQARYSMLTIEGGKVTDIETRDLATFLNGSGTPAVASPDVDPEVFRHPSIFEASAHDSVDVIFGDTVNNHFNRINLRAVTQGRLHVPTGRVTGGYNAPPSFAVAPEANRATLSIHSLWDRDTDNLLFYYYAGNTVQYLMNRGGNWSSMKSVAMKSGLSPESAPDVLRRMMAAE